MLFQFKFNVEKKHVGDVMEALHRFRVDGLDVHPLVTPGAKGRAGGVPAWEAVVRAATSKPLPRAHFRAALPEYPATSVSSGLDQAVRKGALVRSKVKGELHWRAK